MSARSTISFVISVILATIWLVTLMLGALINKNLRKRNQND